MDRRQYHSIQLAGPAAAGPRSAAADAAAQPQPSEGRLGMSSELYLAVCEGRKEEAVALLAADQLAGIDQFSAAGNTVLHLAAEHGHDELIQEFYARSGGNVLLSSRNLARDTPLHCAARAGHDMAVSRLVQQLLAWDKSVMGWKNKAGDTALHLAARLGHGAAVEALVSKAPEVAAEVNDAGVSPLYLAVMSRSELAVRSITTFWSDASAAGPTSQNALHAAVFQGSEMVSLLLRWKPSLAGEVDDDESTPLHFASSHGDCSVVNAILQAASHTARMKDSGGLSALHVAAGMGHVDIIGKLMEACPDAAELRDDRGGTFLHAAARGGHSKVVLFVINKTTLRGLLDAQDGDGNTPLHLAVDARACDVVKALMTLGEARADVMNRDGHTPLDLAAKSTSLFSMLGLVVTLTIFGARSRPRRQDRVEPWSGSNDIKKGIDKTSDGLAVVAVLVATVAFSAANNMPGSYDKGTATLEGKTIFKAFLVLDSFAMITSVAAVFLLVFSKASCSSGSWKSYMAALHCISLSLISMILAFWAALAAVTSTMAVTIACIVIFVVFYYIVLLSMIKLPVSLDIMLKFKKGRHDVTRRRIRQQYPVVDALVTNLLLFMITYCLAIAGFALLSILRRPQLETIIYYLAIAGFVGLYFLGRWLLFRRLWRSYLL